MRNGAGSISATGVVSFSAPLRAALPWAACAVGELGGGDVLVIAEWDRATRSLQDGVAIIGRVHNRGATIKVLDRDYLDLTKPMNRGILALMSALAEDERQRIHRRAGEGRKAAKACGVRFGRKPKLTDHQQTEARQRLADGETCRAIARSLNVHRSTVSRLA